MVHPAEKRRHRIRLLYGLLFRVCLTWLGVIIEDGGGVCGCVLNRIQKRNLPREINRNALTTQAGEVDKDLHRFWGGSRAEQRRPPREAFVAAVADWLGELGSVRKLKVTTP